MRLCLHKWDPALSWLLTQPDKRRPIPPNPNQKKLVKPGLVQPRTHALKSSIPWAPLAPYLVAWSAYHLQGGFSQISTLQVLLHDRCPTWARWCHGLLGALSESQGKTAEPEPLRLRFQRYLAMSWVPNVCAYHGQSGKTCRVFCVVFWRKISWKQARYLLWSGTAVFGTTLLIHVLPCW